jgi:hypothetical protein
MRLIVNSLRQVGFDPVQFARGLRGFPRYVATFLKFMTLKPVGKIKVAPALSDFYDQAGSAKGHYFWQDLLTAQWIYKNRPTRHLDVASRIDGFIAHLLCFRDVDILDVRPLETSIPGLRVLLGNAQEEITYLHGKYDSVSSLHSIEHFGLGRYGDPLDPNGHIKGIMNISKLVEPDGHLFLSFPIGKPEIQFNSQRIIHPEWPIEALQQFILEEFVLIPWKSEPIHGLSPSDIDLSLQGLCGLYKFKRIKE